jgi:hypothetical protein
MGQRRPFWMRGACPVWCDETHRDNDELKDRYHRPDTNIIYVPLTVNDPIDAGEWCGPVELGVDIEQHYREAEPRVVLGEEFTWRPRYELTPDEAVMLGRALVRAGRLAARPRVAGGDR